MRPFVGRPDAALHTVVVSARRTGRFNAGPLSSVTLGRYGWSVYQIRSLLVEAAAYHHRSPKDSIHPGSEVVVSMFTCSRSATPAMATTGLALSPFTPPTASVNEVRCSHRTTKIVATLRPRTVNNTD